MNRAATAIVLFAFAAFAVDKPPESVMPPKTDAEYNALLNETLAKLKVANGKATKDYGIGTYARWDINQTESVLKFSDADGNVRVSSTAAIVGSYSTSSKTFLWAWANKSIAENLSRDSLAVKEYGEKHEIKDLTESKITGEEQDAWAMAALSLKIVGGEAVYRAPTKTGSLFMILKKITPAK